MGANGSQPFILALDQGTTSSRAMVFERSGRMVSRACRDFRQHYPEPGWVEHDAVEIWESQAAAASEAVALAGIGPDDLAAIGLANQRETTVIWERATGQPVHRAMVWQDRRTARQCDELKARGLAGMIRERTGLVLDPYFSATKIAWILDHVPGSRARAEAGELAFGTVDSWLVWNLTRGARHVTDAGNAARTLLFNIHAGAWDDDLLECFGIPRALLPEVVPSSGVLGEAQSLAWADGAPIAGLAGDQQAALFGQRCVAPGMAKNTYGTGCFVVMNTGETPVASRHHLLTTIAWKLDGRLTYALEGSIFMAGALAQWLRDELGLIGRSCEIEALAARAPDNGGCCLVPAFAGLGAPHWNPHARGMITGLTRGASAAHLARAALESIACQTYDVLDAMQRDAGLAMPELRVDGGAAANNLLMQCQSDILRMPVLRPAMLETTALGAAYLAGLAVGFWRDQSELDAHWQLDTRFEPTMSEASAQTLLRGWRRALHAAKAWAEAGAYGPNGGAHDQ